MAFGVKYRLKSESVKYKNSIQIDFLRDGYSGAVLPRKIGTKNIQLRKLKGEGKFRGTVLDVSIRSESNFEFVDFFALDRFKHQVKAYVAGNCVFTGYMIGDTYNEPYRAPKYDVSIRATDGLGLLKFYDFDLTGMVNRMDAIVHCLSKINTGLDIHVAIDLFADGNDTSESFLSQVYYNAKIHAGLKCYEVIEKLLPHNSTITQHNNVWLIRRAGDEKKTHVIYDYSGAKIGTTNGETVLNLGGLYTGDVYPVNSIPEMSFEHSKKRCFVRRNYGRKESILDNYDWSENFNDWILKNIDNESQIINYGAFRTMLIGGCTDISEDYTRYYLLQTVDVQNAGNNALDLSFEFGLRGYQERRSSLAGSEAVTLSMKFQLRFITDSDIYYLKYDEITPDNWAWIWTTDETVLEYSQSTNLLRSSWDKFEASLILMYEGQLQLKFFRVQEELTQYKHIEGVELKKVILNITENRPFEDPEETTVIIRDEALIDAPDVDLLPCDLPASIPVYNRVEGEVEYESYNGPLYFKNGNYTKSGTVYFPVRKWINNNTPDLTEMNVLQYELAKHAFPLGELTGMFRGENMNLNAVIKHALNYNREFTVDEGVWHIYEDVFEVIVIEVSGSADGTHWILESGTWDNSGTWFNGETWDFSKFKE